MSEIVHLEDDGESFLKKVESLSGQVLTLCEQCGICSTSCPMVEEMDFTPAGIVRAVQIGDRSVLKSKAIWVCASCFSCTVRCPRGIDLAKVTEALRELTLRKKVDYLDLADARDEDYPAIALVSAVRKFTG
ncbi:MAG TPA: 4Fe-4S dicluster domain-containing protein [Chloroflexi bacterium]|nr:4Fe-4S dicluster domain-containing protein [Chloroflexota bacterium]